MKIKNLLQAPLILEELKRLKIDPTTLNPNDRVKIEDGFLVFECEKERFVSMSQEKMQYSEEPEYYYLKIGDVVIKGDDFFNTKEWVKCRGLIGKIIEHKSEVGEYRRKIQKNTLPEDGC